MNAPVTIRELARQLHAKSDQWKLMALLRAYFDESGLHEGAPITGVAGFIGPVDAWEELERRWAEELFRFREDTGHNIDFFHATECDSGKGPWFGIAKEIRDAYSMELAKVLVEFKNIKGISIAVETNAWLRFASSDFKKRYASPYQLCAEHCFQNVANYSKMTATTAHASLIFAEHNTYAPHISEIFSYYLRNKAWANIKSLTFASPYDCIALQSADMMSYESYNYWKNGSNIAGERYAFEVLANAGHFEYSVCYGDAGIINAVRKYHANNGLMDPY